MNPQPAHTVRRTLARGAACRPPADLRAAARYAVALLLAALAGSLMAQSSPPAAPAASSAPPGQIQAPAPSQTPAAGQAQAPASSRESAQAQVQAPEPAPARENKPPRASDRRRAAKLYVESTKLFVNRQFEEALKGYNEAAALDPSNADYRLAANVARGHAVTALVQEAAKDRLLGNESAASGALVRALAIDPTNFEATQHLDELTNEIADEQPKALIGPTADKLGGPIELKPTPITRSFHVRADQHQLIEQVFKAYGITAMLDQSVHPAQIRFDLDDASFDEATRVLGLVTNTFYVPVDPYRAVVATDTSTNRQRLVRQDMETVYLSGLTDEDLNGVVTLARNVFGVTQASPSLTARTITLRAPESTLFAFNATMRDLLGGRSQVLLDVRLIQVAHTSARNTGLQVPQGITAFNVYAEEQSILAANSSLVQQIISSGLASSSDPLAILGILIASGQVSSSLLSNGFAIVGGGLAESALSPNNPLTFNLNLNSSDSRELDEYQLRLQDGDEGTLKEGEKYPIQTSSFSSLSPNLPNIAGLTGAGTSSSLGSLLSSLASTVPNIPMVQYQDLGLTLTARPRVLRSGNVALSIDLKLTALSGTSISGNPVLDSRAYAGDTILREGEAAVVATEVDKSESLAISGTPGISEIPGMNNLTGKDLQQNYATIVIVMTPHVVRGTQAAGHTAMMRVEKLPAQQ